MLSFDKYINEDIEKFVYDKQSMSFSVKGLNINKPVKI